MQKLLKKILQKELKPESRAQRDEMIKEKLAVIKGTAKGTEAMEAPRGTLYYFYEINGEGKVVNCNIITPTSQNLARLEIARLTRDRFRELLADGAIAKQDLDRAESDFQAGEAAVRATRERLSILEEGSRTENIRAAQAERDRAAAALEAARANAATLQLRQQDVRVAEATVREAAANVRRLESQVAELKVFAPLTATILTKAVEAGEVVTAGRPLVLLGDLDHPWIKVYVTETEVGKVKLGAPALVLVDSFPQQPFRGTVTWIADQAEFTPKNIQTKEERVNLVYAVKVTIDNAQRKLKAGMIADAELMLNAGVGGRGPGVR